MIALGLYGTVYLGILLLNVGQFVAFMWPLLAARACGYRLVRAA